jgi:hypothetical protein
VEPARADVLGAAVDDRGGAGDLRDPILGELQLDSLGPDQGPVLLDKRVARLGQDLTELALC